MPDTYAEKAAAISEYAIIVNPDDNVAVVKTETSRRPYAHTADGRDDDRSR